MTVAEAEAEAVPGVGALLERTLRRAPSSANTDWDGALLATALLAWEARTGDRAYGDWAEAWLRAHLAAAAALDDAAFERTFEGPRGRVLRGAPVPFSAYCGHWGIVYPCAGLAPRFPDGTAQAQAGAVADYLLTEAPRTPHGCLYHDDGAGFAIPDTVFFAAPPLAIAAALTGRPEPLDEAATQLLRFARLFQDAQTGLAHTLWSPAGMPRSFWSRATAWLAGAFAGTLPGLPTAHPLRAELADRFRHLAGGALGVQREDGGFHLLLDRPDTPPDCTAPALIAWALRTGARRGLLEPRHDAAARRAWGAAARHVSADGTISGAYTGWARPALAEDFAPSRFDARRDFVPGLLLLAAAAFPEGASDAGAAAGPGHSPA